MPVRLDSDRCNSTAILHMAKRCDNSGYFALLPETRHFARPFHHAPFFFLGFIAKSETTSGLCRIQPCGRTLNSAPNAGNPELSRTSRHDREVGMMSIMPLAA